MQKKRAESPFRSHSPFRRAVASYAILYAFIPLGWLAGLAKFAWGPRAYAPSAGLNLGVSLAMTTLFVGCILLWPLGAERANLRARPRRFFVRLILMLLPLASLAYYLGIFIVGEQWLDAALALVPPVGITLICYERGRPLVGALFTLATFTGFFLVGDILGPLPTVWRYASLGPGLYTLRAICSVASFWWAWFSNPTWGRVAFSRPAFQSGALWLALSGALIWILDARYEGHWGDTFWLGFAVSLYFLFRPGPFAERALWALGAAHAIALSVFLLVECANPSVGLWGQLGILHKLFALGYSVCLVVRLKPPGFAVLKRAHQDSLRA